MKGTCKSLIIIVPCALALLFNSAVVTAQKAGDDLGSFNNQWQEFERYSSEEWGKYSQEQNDKWDRFEKEQNDKWLKFKADVEKKWNTFMDSTKKTWVDYSKDLNARSRVDFEKGTIEVEAIVPISSRDFKKQGEKEIYNQIKKMFSTENATGMEVLKDQLKDKKGRVVTDKNLDTYIKKDVAPSIKIARRPFVSADGVKRMKLKVNLNLVPEHIRVRAGQYVPIVARDAKRFNVEPQLVMAIIHTESYFNPMAKSSAGALGLMQLMPRYAARESYNFLYKKDAVLTPSYLYDPENNIELGCTYLYLLRNKHFENVYDPVKKRYLVICAYNWGPGAIQRKIVARYDIDHMSRYDLYMLLESHTPQETKDYLKRVTKRIKIYDRLFQQT